MARFDVYLGSGNAAYLLDVQANELGDLNTRVVVPLMPMGDAPKPAQVLNPVFRIDGTNCVMVTQYMSAVQSKMLKKTVCTVSDRRNEITAALDLLFFGF